MRIGALEAGGTKMVCAVGDETGAVLERIQIPTTQPEETIGAMVEWFRQREIEALGIGCFGPIDLRRGSKTYGYITTTPKPGWAWCNMVGAFEQALGIPVGFDTDVNASVLGEVTYGQARGLDTVLYITVGTGIGLGIYINGMLHHGILHPEGGHVLLSIHPEDHWKCRCPYHPNCLEGLACGPAIEERWGKSAAQLADRPEVWEMEANYLAQALVDYICILSPQKIILGGGVMKQRQLFPLIRSEVARLMNDYLAAEELHHLDTYIVSESLNGDQGILGCLELGRMEWQREKKGIHYGRTERELVAADANE